MEFDTLEDMVYFQESNKDDYEISFGAEEAVLRRRSDNEVVATVKDERAGAIAMLLLKDMIGMP